MSTLIPNRESCRLILIGCLIILLASCSSRRPDGPPRFYVDETRIPNAIPKPEPLAKYGNMPYYYVFGKRYRVMQTSRNYTAIGTASWYGTKFHSRKTSSGEPYNMLAMTAAHKTLPLPTYLEVTNLKNRRKVIVKVNDRGPFSGNRLIDLSYVAAKKLGMLGRGTTTVKIRAIDPYHYGRPIELLKNTPPMTITRERSRYKKVESILIANERRNTKNIYAKTKYTKSSNIYLQVGAFKNKSNALKLQDRLQNLFSWPVVISMNLHSNLYKVQVGPINNHQIANQLMKRLQNIGFKPNKFYAS